MANAIQEKINVEATRSPAAPPVMYVEGAEEGYISMSVPRQRLAAPEIPGYHTHWFVGMPDRIQQAMQAGYAWVDQQEVALSNFDLAGDGRPIEGTDLGTRVSTIAGGLYEGTMQPQRLYLMKIPQWLWEKHQESLDVVNENIAAALRGERQAFVSSPKDAKAGRGQDFSHRYQSDEVGKKKTLFHRKS
jgi:hypothetical protein